MDTTEASVRRSPPPRHSPTHFLFLSPVASLSATHTMASIAAALPLSPSATHAIIAATSPLDRWHPLRGGRHLHGALVAAAAPRSLSPRRCLVLCFRPHLARDADHDCGLRAAATREALCARAILNTRRHALRPYQLYRMVRTAHRPTRAASRFLPRGNAASRRRERATRAPRTARSSLGRPTLTYTYLRPHRWSKWMPSTHSSSKGSRELQVPMSEGGSAAAGWDDREWRIEA